MRFTALLGLLAFVAAPLRADTVLLADGTEHDGNVVKETANEVTFAIRMGGLRGAIVIPKAEILSLKIGALPPDTVSEDGLKLSKLAEAEKEPAKAAHAWSRVGEYYDRHPGYSAHARASYEKVLLFDANHAVARARLGFVKGENGAWKKPEPVRNERATAESDAPGQQAPFAAKPEVAARPEQHNDEALQIGLRKDAETIKKILDEDAARVAAERERLARDRQFARNDYDNYGYGGQYFLLNDGIYYYPPGSVVHYTSGGVFGGYGGYGGHCGGYYGGGYGYGRGCGYGYGSGLSIGFRGNFGNVQFRGGIYNSFRGGRGSRF